MFEMEVAADSSEAEAKCKKLLTVDDRKSPNYFDVFGMDAVQVCKT